MLYKLALQAELVLFHPAGISLGRSFLEGSARLGSPFREWALRGHTELMTSCHTQTNSDHSLLILK